MASDWVESRDGAFREQAVRLIALIAIHRECWGVAPREVSDLEQCGADFGDALTGQAAQAALHRQAVARKQESRAVLERALRAMARRINNHPGMTDALRRVMGLAPPTRTPTRGATPVRGVREERSEGDER